MSATRYRKRPVVIEAIRYNGRNATEIGRWAGVPEWGDDFLGQVLTIRTLEGDMTAGYGDWIIRGVAGELYPCKDSIFQATYEAVES